MTYNLRFGELASLEELGECIKNENPDVVMLQEVDVNTHRKRAPKQNGKHFISELGFYTKMFSVYGKSIPYEGGYYGLGLLSKYPFVSTERILLPMVEAGREQRSLLTGKIELDNGQIITIASTHLDLKAPIRLVQVKYINEVLGKVNNPILLGGDFNALRLRKVWPVGDVRCRMMLLPFQRRNQTLKLIIYFHILRKLGESLTLKYLK